MTQPSMNQPSKWFERKFELSFPVELYPNLCSRLRGAPARLEETVRGCPRELLIRRQGEAWSIQENAGHLLDLEELWLARANEYPTGSGELTAADLSNRKTHEAGHNSREIREILAAFREARGKLLDRIGEFEPSVFARTMLHPRLKTPLRLVDHLYFVAEHDDHHLARIWELRRVG